MSFSVEDFMLGRQQCRQWVPLITQQFRLRHVYQIVALNLTSDTIGSFYFTLHSTSMSAPFYTSEHIGGSNPKWKELNLKDTLNTSASCVVLRIWQHSVDGADPIVLTWGVNFSGLCYIGSKATDIQPVYFKRNSVIFCMHGGFYTSHQVVNTDFKKPIPFLSNLNLIDTSNDKVIYRKVAMKVNPHEVQSSYSQEKLRRLHRLQMEIRNKSVEVHNLREKIGRLNGCSNQRDGSTEDADCRAELTVRCAPQLLTMNYLYKIMQEKPTTVQKQEMVRISKEIEVARFRTRLLSQEKDKKTVRIRSLRQKLAFIVEENEEKNSDLMESYHKLSRGVEKLKEYKKNIFHHRELYLNLNSQLHHRRKQLLRELLFLFPISRLENDNYIISGVYLPHSDVLADCSDTGLAVALGYVAHILIMCSTFLQVPLRYSITHYGSRSFITDNVSLLPDKDRDFPLFTRGKDRAHFTYAVYLLNKNLAQFRWLLSMTTADLRQTLPNLETFLRGSRDGATSHPHPKAAGLPGGGAVSRGELRLPGFLSGCSLADPVLDLIRQESQQLQQRPVSPSRRSISSIKSRSSECGKGLGEILAIPEAYLNRRTSSGSFRSFVDSGLGVRADSNGSLIAAVPPQNAGLIKITNGKEIVRGSDLRKPHNIEQGTDALDKSLAISSEIYPAGRFGNEAGDLHQTLDSGRGIGRSAGSYSDIEDGHAQTTPLEARSPQKKEEEPPRVSRDRNAGGELLEGVLVARADALRATKSFNLMRPKP